MGRIQLSFLFFLVVLCIKSFGQVTTEPGTWKEIESGIRYNINLEDIQRRVLDMKVKAIAEHNDVALARCFADLLLIKDKKTEDSLFFKNAAFMDSILSSSTSSVLLKSIMHLLLARRIQEFDVRFYYRNNKNMIRTGNPLREYALMERKQLDSVIRGHMDECIAISRQLRQTSLEELLWLSSDPLIFLFRPDYTDLLYGERIFMFRSHINIHPAKNADEWLSESQDAFIQTGDQIKTFNDDEHMLFRYYHDWIQYHFSTSPEAAYFIETLARKQFYHNLSEDSANKAAYENYLNQMTLSVYDPVAVHAVYQLCKIWNDEAEKYNPTVSNHPSYYDFGKSVTAFDSSFRWYNNKTLQLLKQFEKKLGRFSYLQEDLLNMKATILAPGLKLLTPDIQMPDSSFPVMVQYKNISHLYTRIIKISTMETLINSKKVNLTSLIKMPVFSEKNQSLILPDDHQWHNSFIKWGPLVTGRYIILFSDTVFTSDTSRLSYMDLTVSNIAVINNDERVFVLHRRTGLPIKNASVSVTIRKDIKSDTGTTSVLKTLSPRTVNDLGYVLVGEKEVVRLLVWDGKDSIVTSINKPKNNIPSGLYDKDEDDGLEEYYEDNIKLNIFTDRAIYRPGQTVFFKGIFTVPDPKTGEIMVLDYKHLKFPFFEHLFYKTGLKKLKTNVTIEDPFNRAVDTFRVTPNKFGSFSGSFLIPANAATGQWDFNSKDYETENQNSGRFRVEEYKRPSFKLMLTKPKNELQLGDSFHILVKVRSFAGAPLSHVQLRYDISHSSYNVQLHSDEILKGESVSDEKGEFMLTVQDSSLASAVFPKDKENSVNYEVNVEAVDETGESHEQELNLRLTDHPVNINYTIPEVIERNGIKPVFISMSNDFSGPVKKPVDIYIYKTAPPSKTGNEWNWPPADIYIYPVEEWQKEFPETNASQSPEREPEKVLIYKTSLPAEAEKKFKLPGDLLVSGNYEIQFVCEIAGRVRGKTTRRFSIFDQKENSFPGEKFEWLSDNSASTGDSVRLISGNKDHNYFSIYHISYIETGKNGASIKFEYTIRKDQKGLNEFGFRIPSGVTGKLLLTHLYIMHNQLYTWQHNISILNKENPAPDIIIEKFRTQIAPGEKETFTVSIKTKNTRELAELMSTMYDASLDELAQNNWAIPRNDIYYNPETAWDLSIAGLQKKFLYEVNRGLHPVTNDDKPLWWISSKDLLRDNMINQNNLSAFGESFRTELQGRVAGVYIQSSSLQDVVVVGYGVSTKRGLAGAATTIRIRGAGSLNSYAQPMIILDGILYTGDLSNVKSDSITEAIVLKGADAIAIYGSRAGGGVLIISTHGPITLPTPPEKPAPPLVIRKNFAESAFFYPMIYAGKDGMYSISFTMPESVTEWKWKLFAHTRNAGFAYKEKSLFSQLPLMVQPSMPRFLYQGDKLVLKTRITNLDTTDLAGQLNCTIEDLVTGENLNAGLLKESSQSFTVKRESNTVGSFTLSIPTGLLHPLRIRISGATRTYSDGEEHIIPVLSRKFLLSVTKPVKSENKHPFQLTTSAFPEDAEPYGLSLYISPKPQTTLMNALTYLAFDPYGCSEQTLNKMLAFTMAIRIAGKDSMLRQDISKIPEFENAGTHDKEDPEPEEQTMPWLQLRHAASIQQQKLRKLFDTEKSKQAFENQLTLLMAMQNADGGLSWFKGGRTDDFISCYVLAGLGKMQQDKLLEHDVISLKEGYSEFLSRLIQYIDGRLITENKWTDPLDFLHARSYWLKKFPVSISVRTASDSILRNAWNNIDKSNLDREATLITVSLRFEQDGSPVREKAIRQLESIRQLAISDSSNGVRWKAVSNADDLDRQDEETIARIAEAFETSGTAGDIIKGIVKWLLRTRSEHIWATTKSTGAIVGLLHTQELSGVTHQLSAKAGDSMLTVTDNLFGGRTADFLDVSGKKFPSHISVSTPDTGFVSGNIRYYYFSSSLPEDSLNTFVKIRKTLFKYDNKLGNWQPINENTELRIADKIKTVLTINTVKQLNYVFINERRAAAMEPQETESGYRYQDGLEYYQSIKDAGYLIFVDKIPSGIHSISYETVVSASGNFTNGPASLQCMYQPSINAFSNLSNIVVVP